MKIEPHCTLIITLGAPPEIRFTQNGKRMASARAIGLTRVVFQLWENTLEDEAMVTAFANLTFHDALIKVTGETKVMRYTSAERWPSRNWTLAKGHEYIIFTIKRWSIVT